MPESPDSWRRGSSIPADAAARLASDMFAHRMESDEKPVVFSSWGPYTQVSGTAAGTAVPGITTQRAPSTTKKPPEAAKKEAKRKEKERQEEIGRLLDRMEGQKQTLCYVFLVSFLALLAGKGFGSLLARKTKPLSRL